MAKELPPEVKLKPKTPRKIPWKKWTNGNAWVARQGTDFDKITCFRVMLYRKARQIGQKVIIIWKPKEGIAEIQFVKASEDQTNVSSSSDGSV